MRWRDVRREWVADPAFAKALEEEFPYRQLADAVIGLRAEFRLTQEQLAEKVGVKQPFIARLESGKYPVDLRTVKRMADALGVTWDVGFSSVKEQAACSGRKVPARARGGRKVLPRDVVKATKVISVSDASAIYLAHHEAAAARDPGDESAKKTLK